MPQSKPAQLAAVPVDLGAIDDLIARMSAAVELHVQRRDRRQVFVFTYRFLTEQMRANLLAGRFMDPPFVIRLMVKFAELYFDAEAAFDRGDAAACPPPWETFFRVARDGRVTDAELLALGMNAHIVHDLPLAMWDTMQRAGDFPPMGSEAPVTTRAAIRHFDHDMVNEVLEETIDRMQDELADRFAWWLRIVDVAMWRVDEWLVNTLLRAARRDVWMHTQALGSARSPAELEAVRRHLVTESMENAARFDLVNAIPSRHARALVRRFRPSFKK